MQQLEAASAGGLQLVDAVPQSGGSAIVGHLDTESVIDHGPGDLEGATARPRRGLVEDAGDGLADQ